MHIDSQTNAKQKWKLQTNRLSFSNNLQYSSWKDSKKSPNSNSLRGITKQDNKMLGYYDSNKSFWESTKDSISKKCTSSFKGLMVIII